MNVVSFNNVYFQMCLIRDISFKILLYNLFMSSYLDQNSHKKEQKG